MDNQLDLLELTGLEIQNIIRNFKKDPTSRKDNPKYYLDRLNRLQEMLLEFKSLNKKIDPNTIPKDHDYFKGDYFNKICALAVEYKEIFEEGLQSFNEPKTSPNYSQDTNGLSNPDTAGVSLHLQTRGILTKFSTKMSSLQRFLSSLTTVEAHPSNQILQARRESLLALWQQLEELYNSILDHFDDPNDHGVNLQAYIELEGQVQDQLIQLSVPTNTQTGTESSIQNTLPLPKLVIPRFDGNYLKWSQFYDLFSHMIDKQNLPNVQKMYYLKSNVTGEAERLINHFAVTDENYNSAWTLLQDRYNNKRLLASSLIQKLLNQPTENGTATSIKSLHDTTQECLLALQNIGVQTQNWDALLLQILIKKLDRTTHIRYEQSISRPKEIQSIQEFLTFLELHFQSLEALGSKGKMQSATNVLTSVVTQNTKDNECKVCKKNSHPLYTCKEFLAMNPSERLKFVRKENLCINCLKFGHMEAQCKSRSCTTCKKRHNTLLHIQSKVENIQVPQNGNLAPESPPATVLSTSAERKGYVLLGTIQLKIAAANGTFIKCRAVLDSGSQINLISEKIAKKLQLERHFDPVSVEGIG